MFGSIKYSGIYFSECFLRVKDGSVNEGACWQIWQPKFNPCDAHSKHRETSLTNCPLTYTCIPLMACTHIHKRKTTCVKTIPHGELERERNSLLISVTSSVCGNVESQLNRLHRICVTTFSMVVLIAWWYRILKKKKRCLYSRGNYFIWLLFYLNLCMANAK